MIVSHYIDSNQRKENVIQLPNYNLLKYEFSFMRTSIESFIFYKRIFRRYDQNQLPEVFNWLRRYDDGRLTDIGLTIETYTINELEVLYYDGRVVVKLGIGATN